MRRRAAFLLALALLTAGAFWFRLPSRDVRPFHADESVHAVKFREIWERGAYRYDPNEFHGPTLYYAALPIVKAFRRRSFAETREGDYRLVTVIFGAALLPLFALFADCIGRRAALMAALLCGISPAFVFYSRYYIQEVLLAFFTLAALGCVWRYRRKPQTGWALGAGLSCGLMIATKETAVLSFAAALTAYGLVRKLESQRGNGEGVKIPRRHFIVATTAGIMAAVLFLSGFGSNWRGPLDYFRAYAPWLKRAGGTETHRHGAGYYLEIMCWHHQAGHAVYSEGFIVGLSLVGIAAAFVTNTKFSAPRPGLPRFFALYTLLLTAAYSLIPYKTPWCVLTFLTGMIFMAGFGADVLLRAVPGKAFKAVIAVLLLAGAAQLGGQAKRASFTAFADPNNPYVYAQTVPDILSLFQKLNDLAEASPQRGKTVVKVISTDGYYWPLPWYLRRYDSDSVGYYTGIPADPAAPIVIAASELDEELTKRLGGDYLMTGFTGLRPGVTYETFVRMDLWIVYLQWKKANGKDNDDP